MPWCKPIKENMGPEHYALPKVSAASSYMVLDDAKRHRKQWTMHREQMLAFQKEAEKSRDIDTARFFREEAAGSMKWQRAWEFVVKWIDGNKEMQWPYPSISEPLAKYCDIALDTLAADLANFVMPEMLGPPAPIVRVPWQIRIKRWFSA